MASLFPVSSLPSVPTPAVTHGGKPHGIAARLPDTHRRWMSPSHLGRVPTAIMRALSRLSFTIRRERTCQAREVFSPSPSRLFFGYLRHPPPARGRREHTTRERPLAGFRLQPLPPLPRPGHTHVTQAYLSLRSSIGKGAGGFSAARRRLCDSRHHPPGRPGAESGVRVSEQPLCDTSSAWEYEGA